MFNLFSTCDLICVFNIFFSNIFFPTSFFQQAVTHASLGDDHTKMINLVHDWIHSFMPHVLRKIDRVHYGLLQPDELARALKLDQNMPESRKLVAVRCVVVDVVVVVVDVNVVDVVGVDVVVGVAVMDVAVVDVVGVDVVVVVVVDVDVCGSFHWMPRILPRRSSPFSSFSSFSPGPLCGQRRAVSSVGIFPPGHCHWFDDRRLPVRGVAV